MTAKELSAYLGKGKGGNFFLLAGPCAVEGRVMAMEVAGELKRVCGELGIPLVFKGSYRKANRSRLDSFTGIGDEKALEILAEVGERFALPTVTDIHESAEAEMAAKYVDMIQIPAFLCRQTELLLAAGRTGKYVNIKKGQFLSPESMLYAVEKVRSTGNECVSVTDRGTSFGYSDLIVDPRAIPVMQEECGCPVIMDVTHSLQQPNRGSGVTGGLPWLISTIARSAVAVGADGLFIETHPDPTVAKSDGANMLPLKDIEPLLRKLTVLRKAVNEMINY